MTNKIDKENKKENKKEISKADTNSNLALIRDLLKLEPRHRLKMIKNYDFNRSQDNHDIHEHIETVVLLALDFPHVFIYTNVVTKTKEKPTKEELEKNKNKKFTSIREEFFERTNFLSEEDLKIEYDDEKKESGKIILDILPEKIKKNKDIKDEEKIISLHFQLETVSKLKLKTFNNDNKNK